MPTPLTRLQPTAANPFKPRNPELQTLAPSKTLCKETSSEAIQTAFEATRFPQRLLGVRGVKVSMGSGFGNHIRRRIPFAVARTWHVGVRDLSSSWFVEPGLSVPALGVCLEGPARSPSKSLCISRSSAEARPDWFSIWLRSLDGMKQKPALVIVPCLLLGEILNGLTSETSYAH